MESSTQVDISANPSMCRLICIVISGTLSYAWAWGVFYAFDVYFTDIKSEFDASYSSMAWVQSLSAGLCQFCAFPISMANMYVPSRLLILFGMTLVSIGYFTSFFATHLWNLYLSYGILCGVGGGSAFTSSIGVVKQYQKFYKNHVGLILGIVQSGSGLGSLIVTPINNWMVAHFSWRYGLLYTSFAAVVCTVFMTISMTDYEAKVTSNQLNLKDKFKQIITNDYCNLLLLCISMPLLFLGYWTVFVFVEPYLNETGLSSIDVEFILSGMGISNIIGRILFGYLSDNIDSKYVFIFCIICKSIITTSFVFITQRYVLYAVFITVGLFAGCIALLPKLILSYFNKEHFLVVLGLCVAICSFGSIVGQPIIGFLIKETNNWHIPGTFAGGSMLLSVIPLSFMQKPTSSTNQRSLISKRIDNVQIDIEENTGVIQH